MSMKKLSHAYVDINPLHGHNFGMYVPKSSFVWNTLVCSGNKNSLQSSQESL